jgi:transmembrane sensor
MSPLSPRPEAQRTPHDIAADWWLREAASRLSPADAIQREHWLEEDPAHRTAWDSVRLAMTTVGDNAADPELMAMRAAALTARGEPRWGLRALSGIGLAAAVAVGVALFMPQQAQTLVTTLATSFANGGPAAGGPLASADPDTAVYRTAVGERATIALPDGSTAALDTNSVLEVAYTPAERHVNLVRGQALFEVAKHKPAPFLVVAGNRRITAVGTKFNVRVDDAGPNARASVTLIEGVVRVATIGEAGVGAPAQTITLAAGQWLNASAAAPMRLAAADIDRVASWRDGVLSFEDRPLGQAVAEMNRYTNRPITVADTRLAGLRVSGVFKTGDPEHFAETMAEVFPITVDYDNLGRPVLKPKG